MPAGYNVEDFGGEDRQRLREVLAEALGVPLELLHITNVRGSESVAAGGSQRRFLQAVTILVDYNIDLLEIDQATQVESSLAAVVASNQMVTDLQNAGLTSVEGVAGTLNASLVSAPPPPFPPPVPPLPPVQELTAEELLLKENDCDIRTEDYNADIGQCVCKVGYYRARSARCELCVDPVNSTIYAYGGSCPNPCPPGALCPFGGTQVSNLIARDGYWRASDSVVAFYQCPMAVDAQEGISFDLCGPGYCQSGDGMASNIVGTNQTGCCREGHEGPLCSICSPGFGRQMEAACVKCEEEAGDVILDYFLIILAASLFCGVVAGGFLWTSFRDPNDTRSVYVVSLVKIFFSYIQTNGLVSLLRVQFREYVQIMIDLQDKIGTLGGGFDFASFNCRVQFGFYQRYLFYVSLPVTSILGCAIFAEITRRIRRRLKLSRSNSQEEEEQAPDASAPESGADAVDAAATAEDDAKPHEEVAERRLSRQSSTATSIRRRSSIQFSFNVSFENGTIFVLFILFPTISRNILRIFVCDYFDVGDGKEMAVLRQNRSITCHDDVYNTYHRLGIVGVSCFCFGFPLLVLLRLLYFKWRGELQNTETRRRLGFLFLGFRPKYWWWELVVLTRKLAMVVVMVFFDNMEYFQVLFVTIAVVINLVAQCLAKAYDRVIVNRYEVWR